MVQTSLDGTRSTWLGFYNYKLAYITNYPATSLVIDICTGYSYLQSNSSHMTSEMSTRFCTDEVKVKVKTNSISGMVQWNISCLHINITTQKVQKEPYKKWGSRKAMASHDNTWYLMITVFINSRFKVKVQGTNYGIHVCYLNDFQFYNFWYTDK